MSVSDMLRSQRWRKARNGDHFWVSRRTWAGGQEAISKMVELIQGSSTTVRYGKNLYIVVDVDGWRVWTMGAPPEITVVINCKPLTYELGGGN